MNNSWYIDIEIWWWYSYEININSSWWKSRESFLRKFVMEILWIWHEEFMKWKINIEFSRNSYDHFITWWGWEYWIWNSHEIHMNIPCSSRFHENMVISYDFHMKFTNCVCWVLRWNLASVRSFSCGRISTLRTCLATQSCGQIKLAPLCTCDSFGRVSSGPRFPPRI